MFSAASGQLQQCFVDFSCAVGLFGAAGAAVLAVADTTACTCNAAILSFVVAVVVVCFVVASSSPAYSFHLALTMFDLPLSSAAVHGCLIRAGAHDRYEEWKQKRIE